MPSDTTGRRTNGRRSKPDLNIDTSSPPPIPRSRDRDRDIDDIDLDIPLPQTPTRDAPGAGRTLRLPTDTDGRDTSRIETFLESLTPVDGPIDMPSPDNEPSEASIPPSNRDSHDLSLSPRQVTRDSLVANMLLSLDKLSSFGAGGSPFDEPAVYRPYDETPRAMTFTSSSRPPRVHGHGHGYSYSSDFETADDASRISSRGRRSNSSSGYPPPSLGRIHSMRETGSGRAMHSRGGKGSKSSSLTSVDAGYAQVVSNQRWTRGYGPPARSSSFDGEPRPVPAAAAAPSWQLDLAPESSSSFFNDVYDAAPTPTIPGGPRKLASTPSMPSMTAVPPPPPPPPPASTKPSQSESRSSSGKGAAAAAPERRRSTRSSRSATVGRTKAESKLFGDAPPLPNLDFDSAPAPHIGYEKSKDPIPASNSAAAVPQQKEKQSFFRRMFGSTKSALSSSPSTLNVASTFPPPQKSTSTPPSRDSTAHTLQKKTSAFFRRRKYSLTEPDPPPPPPVPAVPAVPGSVPTVKLPLDKFDVKPEPSPITSLRQAMDPFLQGSPMSPGPDTPLPSVEGAGGEESARCARSPPAQDDDDQHRVRGFSPDYEPSPKAVIRKVESETPLGGSQQQRPAATPSRRPGPAAVESPPKSFLQDNSDSEDSPVRHRQPPPRDQSLKPTTTVQPDGRTRSPSPVVSKSKSVPNLNREARLSARMDSKRSPPPPSPGRNEPSPADASTEALYRRAVPSLRIDSAEPSPSGAGTSGGSAAHSSKSIDEPDIPIVGDPTEDDRQKAQKIFDGNEDFIAKDKAAAWMGEEGNVRQRTLRAYMELYDFEGLSVVQSLRQVCQRLLLRAETQQLDRILVAFAKRWCECNANHGFKSLDVIHTICYSIILLNTDLHMADIEHKMTRSQFIKNTMTTIRQTLQESVPEAFDRPSVLPGKGAPEEGGRTSEDFKHNSFRASFKPPPRPGSAIGSFVDAAPVIDTCGPLVKAPFDGPLKAWEAQVEVVLKDIYASIRDDRLPLFGADPAASAPPTPGGLSVMGMLKRSPSVLSKAPSEGVASTRGRVADVAKSGGSSRWTSKSRSRPRGAGPGGFHTGFSSSRTSFEDGGSVWTPTENSSATWSRLSLGRTHTSMSMDSFGSAYPRGEYHQSIGFANALSQAIIREDSAMESKDDVNALRSEHLLDDESLELAGPPWIKEGIVTHKHHLDGTDKRAKDRNWTEVFAVIQKGQLSLFSFAPNKSLRHRRRGPGGVPPKGAVVGGGNWRDNATSLGTFSLRQTLASALPPPGYSRTRPHVWALSLPTGAVHLFQVGTPEILKEFVSTANYWSARLSTHPMVGGVSNIEYGWSEAIINAAATVNITNTGDGSAPNSAAGRPMSASKPPSRPGSATTGPPNTAAGRASMQSGRSMRSSSFDMAVRPGSNSSGILTNTLSRHQHMSSGSFPHHGYHTPNTLTKHQPLPGDRVHITDWTPPTQSMRPSPLNEKDQLESLEAYVKSVEAELQAHNALRSPMLGAFSPKSTNAAKAMANWGRKSEYLLREIVRYRTYVESLRHADGRRSEVYAEREERGGGKGVAAPVPVVEVEGVGVGEERVGDGEGLKGGEEA
ncbi:hypothetical protein VTJ49DRAFT_2964 [Mycothermus thermophilus]|uniref:SEC7 domain-containing protein n=1 Tax=Humicola insolens TaxID=85995 RepID=A0ABR3V8S8_HUMIN